MCRSSDHERSTNGLSQNTRWASRVLVSVLFAGLGLLFATRLHADLLTLRFPDRDILVHRSLEPSDLSAVSNGGSITVTIDITNNEDVALRGLYYSDQVPNGWAVSTIESTVDGAPIADYAYGEGDADEIYAGFTPSRWALELPQGAGLFSPTHPIPASGGAARIVYTMLVSAGTGDDYATEHDGWAGWLETQPTGTAVFGYQDIPLSADFSGEPRSDIAPFTVQFTDLSTGDPTAWAWDFGDGDPISVQQHPTHTYAIPGAYTVTLTVTRTDPVESATVVKPNYITVIEPPLKADFSAQPRFGLPPLTVQFTDLSTGDILTRAWDFGDGQGTAWPPGPIHAYHDLGYYTVSLTVQDAYEADVRVRSRYIHVTHVIYYVHLPVVSRSHTP
jgi:PKD repeat protein